MKVTILILENVEKEIGQDINNFLSEDDAEERKLNRLLGKEEEPRDPIIIDITKYYKKSDFYFKKCDVKGIYMSSNTTVKGERIMVILLDGKEFDCIFDEEIFEELKEQLNQ